MTHPHIERVERILGLLEETRTRGLTCSGWEKHRFRLNPPIPEATIAAFESTHQIHLPMDFRTFLTSAGNGGAGPYYGIYPLEKCYPFRSNRQEESVPDALARPCPLHLHLDESDNWADQLGGIPPYQGTFAIGTQGSTYEILLIITGEYRGRVVYADTAGNSAPHLAYEPDFLAWYERWLTELLDGYETRAFGFDPGGGEENLFRILEDSNARPKDRSAAAHAFARLPRLSDPATARLRGYASDPVAEVRASV